MEKVFYDQDGIWVSSTRFMVNDQTFALSQITSVRVDRSPPKTGCATVFVAAGITIIIIGFLLAAGDVVTGLGTVVLGGFSWLIGYLLRRAARGEYAVLVRTASGEEKVLIRRDEETPASVVAAINQAIVSRG